MANLANTLGQLGLLGSANTTLSDIKSALVRPYQAVGLAAPGAITVSGVKVGDKVLVALGWATSAGTMVGLDTTHFEATVTVANQIQQISSDLSSNTYLFLVQPAN